MDQRKGWRAAEKLLRQGKVQAALQQLQKVSEGSLDDTVTLNRLADLLAQQQKYPEAISFYKKIARRFEDGGFVPKAIAIHKKVLRLDPDHVDSAIGLGRLYHRQKLQGEARKYLLHAANRCLEAKDFSKAREVFERLVQAEPDDLRHRVRLAETRVAQGDAEGAASDLVTVGQSLLDQGEVEEASWVFKRSQELAPERDSALIGAARCFEALGRVDRSLELLETRVGAATPAANVLGELARCYDAVGRRDDAFKLLEEASPLEVSHDTWKRMLGAAIARGDEQVLWNEIDRQLGPVESTAGEQIVDLLSELIELEPDGHIPALHRLTRWHEARGEVRRLVGALEALARAYGARSMDEEAARTLERMREIAPPDEEPRAASDTLRMHGHCPSVNPTIEDPAPVTEAPVVAHEAVPLEAEAPAVPLSRADEEFVTGWITQAEVLEKYDLGLQALEQLEEVVNRFPGHVPTLERRVALTRALARDEDLAVALTQLALARRAGGDASAAAQAASEAGAMACLPADSRRVLERLGLIDVQDAGPTTSASPPTGPIPSSALAPGTSSNLAASGGTDEVVIDLDDEDVPLETEPAAESKRDRSPSPELLVEIRNEAAEGKVVDARRKLDALVLLGYAGPELEQVRHEIGLAADLEGTGPTDVEALAPTDVEAPAPTDVEAPAPMDVEAEFTAALAPAVDDPAPTRADDADESALPGFPSGDDLEAIRAALEQELADDDAEPVIAEQPEDESVEEILKEFRKRVDAEVDTGDHRTHYDLGIGYKEMGLTDEAIQEFERAAQAPELHREACAMLAMCHKDRQDLTEAARCLRAALEGEPDDTETSRGLRYDLAEVLLEGGDPAAALETFRDLLRVDPTFRDVSGRITELEGRLQS